MAGRGARWLVELLTEISRENELSVTEKLKNLPRSCVGVPAVFLCGISLEFAIGFSQTGT